MKTRTKLLAIMIVAAFLVMMSPTVSAWPYPNYDKTGLLPSQPALLIYDQNLSTILINPDLHDEVWFLYGAVLLPYNTSWSPFVANSAYRISLKITYPNGYALVIQNMSTQTTDPAQVVTFGGINYWQSSVWLDVRNQSLSFNQTGMYRFNYYVDCIEWTYIWWFGWWLPWGSHMVQLGASNAYYNTSIHVTPTLPTVITGAGLWWIGAVTGTTMIFLPVLMAFGWRRSGGVGKVKLIVIGGVTMLLLYVMTMVFLPLG
jgi:hypothetical protein